MWITLATDDGPMRAYVATSGAGTHAGIVVLQEAFGVNAYVRGVVDALAAAGYVALAPELWHRLGEHVEVPYDHMLEVMGKLATIDVAMLERDVTSAVAALRARPDVDRERIGVVGFCVGGYAAILTGLACGVQSVVAFYPGGLVHPRAKLKLVPLLPRLPAMRAATMLQLGGQDTGIPEADVAAIRTALARSPARHAITVHADAKHGFHTHDRSVYDAPAAELAWRQTLAWLSDTLH